MRNICVGKLKIHKLKKRADTKLYRQSREKIYIKGIGQRHMPDFLGGHPDNLTEF